MLKKELKNKSLKKKGEREREKNKRKTNLPEKNDDKWPSTPIIKMEKKSTMTLERFYFESFREGETTTKQNEKILSKHETQK